MAIWTLKRGLIFMMGPVVDNGRDTDAVVPMDKVHISIN